MVGPTPRYTRSSLTADRTGGGVLAYEKDPANHVEACGRAGRRAPLTGNAVRGYGAPHHLSRCGESGRPS